jgi:hypothetical protein
MIGVVLLKVMTLGAVMLIDVIMNVVAPTKFTTSV